MKDVVALHPTAGLLRIAVTCTVFLVIGALLAWAAGQATLALSFAAALGILLPAAYLAALLADALAKALRSNIYDRAPLYITLHLLASCSLTVAWVAHAAKLLATAHASGWQAALLFIVGLLATVVAVHIVQEFFNGQLYSLAVAFLGSFGYLAWGGWAVWG